MSCKRRRFPRKFRRSKLFPRILLAVLCLTLICQLGVAKDQLQQLVEINHSRFVYISLFLSPSVCVCVCVCETINRRLWKYLCEFVNTKQQN